MYCPLASMREHKYLSVFYPNEFKYYMNVCKETEEKMNKPFSIWQQNPKYNTVYRVNRINEMELKEIEKW